MNTPTKKTTMKPKSPLRRSQKTYGLDDLSESLSRIRFDNKRERSPSKSHSGINSKKQKIEKKEDGKRKKSKRKSRRRKSKRRRRSKKY